MVEATQRALEQRAHERFGRLRREAVSRLENGVLAAELRVGGSAPPSGWCVSCIARVVTNRPELVAPIEVVQSELSAIGECTRYAPESLHVSLLGLTTRSARESFDAERVAALRTVVRRELAGVAPSTMALTGVNLTGNQWFLEAVPGDGSWARLRRRLAAAATVIGEEPMVHPDTEPVHLNIARISSLESAAAAVRLLTSRPFTESMIVSTIELVITDFVVDPAVTVVIDTIGA